MIVSSIRGRLLLWIGLLFAVILTGFAATAYQLMRTSGLADIDADLAARASQLAFELRSSPDGRSGPRLERPPSGRPPLPRLRSNEKADDGPPSFGDRDLGPPPDRGGPGSKRTVSLTDATEQLFGPTLRDAPFYAFWSSAGELLKRSAHGPDPLPQPTTLRHRTDTQFSTQDGYRIALYHTERGDAVLAGASLTRFENEMRTFLWWLAGAAGVVLALGAGGAAWLVNQALAPVQSISATARRIAAGDLTERISDAGAPDELQRLVTVLNDTFSRLETAFAEQRQFTADASHEIRTPLAVIIAEAQATLARPRSDDEYRETLETCLEAAQDLRRLVDSLLSLARLDAGASPAATVCDLAEVARDCLQLVRPLAEAKQLTLVDEIAPASTPADPGRLRQVIVNLLDNAIHYNYDRGTIRLSTRAEADAVFLVVSDTGRGIAPDDLPHVFKRFYRADKVRTLGERRAGLGLAIVKSIVDRLGGSITVTSELGLGTTFTVRLPRARTVTAS